MTKTTIKETIEKYDSNGQLIEKITREEVTEDDTYAITTYPDITPNTPYTPLYPYYSYANVDGGTV